jgi:RimJ/RimL family protein N-acetyltransferase
MKATEIFLYPARMADAYPLWLWANDPETRAASHGRAPVEWQEHVQWLRSRIDNPSVMLWVAIDEANRPVGSVRLEATDGWKRARLSYVVAPESRGQGLARLMLVEAIADVILKHPAVVMEAEVLNENERSLRQFRRLGWSETSTERGTVLFVRERETQ